VAIQGFGNVGSYAGKFLGDMGCKLIAASDVHGGLHAPDGFDTDALFDYACEHRTIKGCGQGKEISNDDLIALEVDFLIPAALGGVIHKMNVDQINCRYVFEAANGPTTPPASETLFKKGVHVVPDILTNAGGVTVSYFEWVQNLQQFQWEEEDVNAKLERKLVNAFKEVAALSDKKKISLRTAAYMVAIDRVARAFELRGV
jgi:glutamate dehydrogenase/leucine dehydrogenase